MLLLTHDSVIMLVMTHSSVIMLIMPQCCVFVLVIVQCLHACYASVLCLPACHDTSYRVFLLVMPHFVFILVMTFRVLSLFLLGHIELRLHVL